MGLLRINVLFVFFVSLFFLGCKEIIIENGEIPQEHLEHAQKFIGDYSGQFASRKGILTIGIKDENKPYIAFKSEHGDDLLGTECESEIGSLLKVSVGEQKGKPILKSATFAFEPNQCAYSILGRELLLQFKVQSNNVKVLASVYQFSEWVENCYLAHDPTHGNYLVCHQDLQPRYLRGLFKKNTK